MITLEVIALKYATEAHRSIDQKRKFTGEEYVIHPIRVAHILKQFGVEDTDIICAAYLHDVLEDVYPVNTEFSPESIKTVFNPRVLNIVLEVTDVYTSMKYPGYNRKKRSKLEAERLSNISEAGLIVKFADLIDNTDDIAQHDKGFAVNVYLPEKQRFLGLVKERVDKSSNTILKELYSKALENAFIKL